MVELDRAVVARARLLAAVEQSGGEVGREAADRDHLRAAVDALRREAGQARDQFRDRDVGQLADVFGRDRLDDALLAALRVDESGCRADTGDDDRALVCRSLPRVGRLGFSGLGVASAGCV